MDDNEYKEIKKQFALKIKQVREEHKLSQKELGELIGGTNHHVSEFEREHRLPNQREFKVLCDILNKNENWFFPKGTPNLRKDFDERKRKTKRDKYSRGYQKNDFGAFKRNKEEIEAITKLITTTDGEIYDIENDTNYTEQIKQIQNVENKIDKKDELSIIEDSKEVKNVEPNEIIETSKPTNKSIKISIPMNETMNITICIEENKG